MALIRKIEIECFRGIKKFAWCPFPGINCLIGPGDTGKSTILDAIDLCLGTRRNPQFTDADFSDLDIDTPIKIAVTLGDLEDDLKNIDSYGLYLRGFDAKSGATVPEPEAGLETVLTVQLTVGGDLEPAWTLISERAAAQSQTRNLNWTDRVQVAPTRIGAFASHNLGWGRGSILNKLSEERVDASAALAKAARDARSAFGEQAKGQLGETLKVVLATASELGVPVGQEVKAMLDAQSLSFSGGTVSLHDEGGVPLKGLGLGSTRLLIAGLQRKAAAQASIILVDELEHGLEPHRIIRFVDALGAKEKTPPLQVFMTTHSPVAVRELSGRQLFIMRAFEDHHEACLVGSNDEVQGAVRLFPEALLAPSIIVCEGASEIGLVRGLDQHRVKNGQPSISAYGVATIDGGGNNTFRRARAFQSLGYRIAVLRDSDVHPTPDLEKAFSTEGGTIFAWGTGLALEDELFLSLSDSATDKLLEQAIELKEAPLINDHIKSASNNATDLNSIQAESVKAGIGQASAEVLAKAAKSGRGWFKTVSAMETIGREIVAPDLPDADKDFVDVIEKLFEWATDVAE